MFDDRLQDIIMQEMMSEFGTDVRTDEGSLAYNACAKIAQKLEQVYGDMDEINDNIIPSTMDDAHLIRYGTERGLPYTYATAPIVRGVFQQEIEIGERFNCNDYIYEVISKISEYEYEMRCDTEGVEANANRGDLEPVDYIDDYMGGIIVDIIEMGQDDEDIEKYRSKVLDTFKTTAFGGNKMDYRLFVNKIPGVGGCKPMRRQKNSPYVNVYIITNDYSEPDESMIQNVQTIVDPEENSGEGDGQAPICHHVKIYGAKAVDVNITCQITFDIGYTKESLKVQIENAIKDYLEELRESWESNDKEGIIVRMSKIESKILDIDGILDAVVTSINGAESNLLLDYTQIPWYGGVFIV